MAGQTARISVAPLLADQISRLKLRDFAEKDHFGVFTVNVYCRLVGSSSYDRMDEKDLTAFRFHWRPAGFKQAAKNMKELLEIKPSVTVE
jgi:hypothetical protein